MSSYKKNAASNRDALFGGAAAAGGGDKKKKSGGSSGGGSKSRQAPKDTSRGYQSRAPAPSPSAPAPSTFTTARHNSGKSKKPVPKCVLSEDAQLAKRKEADDYKAKALAAMQKTFFSRPDPVAASTYYKRAADCYQALCDFRTERLYRLESARCNRVIAAWASCAADFTRAAELALIEGEAGTDDVANSSKNAHDHYRQAGEAWTQQNERAKAAACQVKAAMALNSGEPGSMLSKAALAGMEEAVEAHVPDVLNPFCRYRQTGVSAFVDPNDDQSTAENPTPEMLELANTHLVSKSYAHEPLLDLVNSLSDFGEYASALYAAGAARTLLEKDGISTLTLGRVYVVETILMLAMGDPVAAEQVFLSKHVQSTPYLSSRECKLAEDLFRAVKMRDGDALEEARDPAGPNRSGLANLHPSLQQVVKQIRLSGVARKAAPDAGGTTAAPPPSKPRKSGSSSSSEKKKKKKPSSSSGKSKSDDEGESPAAQPAETAAAAAESSLQEVLNMKTGYEKEAAEGEHLDADALDAELDGLDFGDDGLGSDEEDDFDLR